MLETSALPSCHTTIRSDRRNASRPFMERSVVHVVRESVERALQEHARADDIRGQLRSGLDRSICSTCCDAEEVPGVQPGADRVHPEPEATVAEVKTLLLYLLAHLDTHRAATKQENAPAMTL